MKTRPGRRNGATATHCSKRARRTADGHRDETKRSRVVRPEFPLPPSVISLVWSFLLEPSYDPTSTKASVDFDSIASFMLVSRGTKEAFDACNGWSMCLQAVKREIDAKEEFIDGYKKEANTLARKGGLSNKEIQLCRSLLDDADSIRAGAARLVFVKSQLLPVASRLAGIYCGERVPRPEVFKMMEIMDGMVLTTIPCTFAMLELIIMTYAFQAVLA